MINVTSSCLLLGPLQNEEKLQREALRQDWVKAQEKIKSNWKKNGCLEKILFIEWM